MLRFYLRSVLRNLWADKNFAIINISGISLAISVCLVAFLFAAKEFSYDKFHSNADKLFRLYDRGNNSSLIHYKVKQYIIDQFPEIKAGTVIQKASNSTHTTFDGRSLYSEVISVDNDFFEVFSSTFLSKHSTKPFSNTESAIITEGFAKQLFLDDQPLGKRIMLRNRNPLIITGVIKDFPENSSIQCDLLVNVNHKEFKFRGPEFNVYFELNDNVRRDTLVSKINHILQAKYDLLPLSAIHLHDPTDGGMVKRGNLTLINLFLAISMIILIIALINFINLSLARQSKKTVLSSLKKTLGASEWQIRNLYLIEGLFFIIISFVVSVVILGLTKPYLHSILDTTLDIQSFLSTEWLLSIFFFISITGPIAGWGPAIVYSRVTPIDGLKRTFYSRNKGISIRSLLVLFQFTVSIIFICCVIIFQRQIGHIKHHDLKFNGHEILQIDIPGIQQSHIDISYRLKEEFLKSPYIENVSLSSGIPGKIKTGFIGKIESREEEIFMVAFPTDPSFLDIYGIKTIIGRKPADGDFNGVCLINKTAFELMELEDLNNKMIHSQFKEPLKVIGVVDDFNFQSLHNDIRPLIIYFPDELMPSSINIQFANNALIPGMDFIQETWKKLNVEIPLQYEFVDDLFNSMYKDEEQLADGISILAILAIVISCIGTLGLMVYESERKIKEIGIRKVNGAKVTEILTLLNKDFVKWVVIAFIIATPIAWYAMDQWLQNFAYKTELSWWVFALAGLLALGIALLTVSWQSWKAATRNPVEALRYE
ncbi:MAG: ABC transporter permease [Cyclobacteriaceae bacterium]